MARDRFKEQVAADEAQELVERLGYTLAKSHAGRQARKALTPEERLAWEMIERRVKRPDEPEVAGFDENLGEEEGPQE